MVLPEQKGSAIVAFDSMLSLVDFKLRDSKDLIDFAHHFINGT